MKVDIEKLLADHKKLIEQEASKYSGYLSNSFVLAEAYKLAREAANNYDPSTGFKFSTMLVNSLKKLSRLSTQYGGMFRIPENKQFKIQKLNKADEELRAEYGREPSLQELSNFTGMSLKEVTNLSKVRKKEVNISNLAYTPTFVEDQNDDWIHYVYHDLADRDKLILEYKTGFGGKPVLTNEEIAKKIGIPVSTVVSRGKIISNMLAEGWRE